MTQHLKPRSTTVVLYQGDDMDRLADLKRAVDIAERVAQAKAEETGGSAARFGDDEPTNAEAEHALAKAQAAYDTFVDEAAERALSVQLRSIGRKRFRDLLLEHPPRKVPETVDTPRRLAEAEAETVETGRMVDHPDDADWGVNTETFPEALLAFRSGGLVTIGQPNFDSSADVESFINDELAEGDFEQLWVAAFMLNRSPSADPQSRRYSTGSPSTGATSK